MALRRLAAVGGGLAATGVAGYLTVELAPTRPIYLTRNGPAICSPIVRKQPADLALGRSVATERFRQGQWWEWLYRDGKGNVQAFERYSVRDVSGDEVILDMATKMERDAEYQVCAAPFCHGLRCHASCSRARACPNG